MTLLNFAQVQYKLGAAVGRRYIGTLKRAACQSPSNLDRVFTGKEPKSTRPLRASRGKTRPAVQAHGRGRE